jgi:nucleotide-binding universal stress UspA family protein
MIRKILATLDGSKTSESVLAHVGPLMGTFDAEATLAMVLSDDKASWKAYALSYLEALAKRLRAGGGRVDVAVLAGTPAPAIAQFAAGERYDLLAVCSRGRSGLRRLLLGSVAEEILRRASVPVLLAHPPIRGVPPVTEFRRIVVPLDGSHRSASVLPCVSEIAAAHGAKVTFVTVVSPTQTEDLPADTVCHNLFREQDRLKGRGLEVEVAVLYGDPATQILAFAANHHADLMAISTHGRTGLDRMRNGSVTETILRKSRRTMLVFRRAAIVREHPVHARGAEACRRAMGAFADAGAPGKGPYSR